jgi:hypothetical protein
VKGKIYIILMLGQEKDWLYLCTQGLFEITTSTGERENKFLLTVHHKMNITNLSF